MSPRCIDGVFMSTSLGLAAIATRRWSSGWALRPEDWLRVQSSGQAVCCFEQMLLGLCQSPSFCSVSATVDAAFSRSRDYPRTALQRAHASGTLHKTFRQPHHRSLQMMSHGAAPASWTGESHDVSRCAHGPSVLEPRNLANCPPPWLPAL
jgi:hypothetical protein